MQNEVEHLGHVVDENGIRPTQEKVKALQEARPTKESKISRYLGLLRYYDRFLPAISTILQPVDELRQLKTNWVWRTDTCQAAFQQSKTMILKAPVLCHAL